MHTPWCNGLYRVAQTMSPHLNVVYFAPPSVWSIAVTIDTIYHDTAPPMWSWNDDGRVWSHLAGLYVIRRRQRQHQIIQIQLWTDCSMQAPIPHRSPALCFGFTKRKITLKIHWKTQFIFLTDDEINVVLILPAFVHSVCCNAFAQEPMRRMTHTRHFVTHFDSCQNPIEY